MHMADHGERKRSSAWRVVFVIALLVLVGSLVALGLIAFSYWEGQQKYGDIADESGFEVEDVENRELAELSVDWDSLLAANGDTVAWLYISNTSINYPVVQATDNDYYLTHDFDGEAGWLANYGAVFMDYRNDPDWSDSVYFVYGHHMNDGSMFTDLAGLTDQARFEECRTVYLLTLQGNFKLRTFAMLHVSADDEIVQPNFASAQDMAAYVQDKIDRSVVTAGDVPDAGDITKAFAFATCDNQYTDGRYILYAYVDSTTAEGLTGELGVSTADGETGFVNDLVMEG